MSDLIEKKRHELGSGKKSGALSREAQFRLKQVIKTLEQQRVELQGVESGQAAFAIIKKNFDAELKALKKAASDAGEKLSHMFQFCEEVFPDGQELLILVTELTINPIAAAFINQYGCKEYFKYNKDLLLYDRQQEIISELETLQLN